MDERLQKALEFSNYIATLNNQKKHLKNRVKQVQTVHYKGGVFMADQTTIAFVSVMLDTEKLIITDTKDNPIVITQPSEFLNELTSAYNRAMLEYEFEYEKLKKSRSIKKIMDW